MPNTYFQFKQFTIHQDQCAMKVSTEACILGAWVPSTTPSRILDIGTGTGLLALMLAQRFECPIDAVELDELAAQQAFENTSNCPWANRINVINQDIRHFAIESEKKYDLIVCNPPFFKGNLKSKEESKNIAKHETKYFDKQLLVKTLTTLLSEEGSAFVLYPEDESISFEELVSNSGLFAKNGLVIRNQPNSAVFRIITRVAKFDSAIETTELSIRNGLQYSMEMKSLIQNYYL